MRFGPYLGSVWKVLLLRAAILWLRPGCSAEAPCDGIGTRLGRFDLRPPVSLSSRGARDQALPNRT